VTLKFKRAAPAAGGLLGFLALAGWLLCLMPPPHRPLEYMIAGTAATAAALAAVFARAVTRFERCGSPRRK
jgi:hypothetical protein